MWCCAGGLWPAVLAVAGGWCCWPVALAVAGVVLWRGFCRDGGRLLHGLWGDYRGVVDRLGIDLIPRA